jgi:hypothetical protein
MVKSHRNVREKFDRENGLFRKWIKLCMTPTPPCAARALFRQIRKEGSIVCEGRMWVDGASKEKG